MKSIFWAIVGFGILWFIKTTDLLNVLLLFMIAGVIPGTNILLPPLVMMVLLSLMLLGIAWWLGRKQLAAQLRELKNKSPKKRTVKSKATIKPVKKRKTASKKANPKRA